MIESEKGKQTHDCDSTADKVSRISPKLSLWLPSQEKPSALKRENHFNAWNFLTFSFFCG